MADEHGLALGVLFVDDGSSDGSWDVVRQLAEQDSRVRGIRFRRNFGKAAALAAGFAAVRGEIVVTLDADLQDDPAEIPRLIARLDEGLDVVSGWKRKRHDPLHKVWPSRAFNWMVGRITGLKLHDHNCGLKAYRAAVTQEMPLYGEMHRFITVLAHARGFRVGEVVVNHRARKHGVSKYGARRFVRGFLDLLTVHFLTTYGQCPMHIWGGMALVLGVLGMAGAAAGLALCLSGHVKAGGALLAASLLGVLVAGHVFAVGLVAELQVARGARGQCYYSVAETAGTVDCEGETEA